MIHIDHTSPSPAHARPPGAAPGTGRELPRLNQNRLFNSLITTFPDALGARLQGQNTFTNTRMTYTHQSQSAARCDPRSNRWEQNRSINKDENRHHRKTATAHAMKPKPNEISSQIPFQDVPVPRPPTTRGAHRLRGQKRHLWETTGLGSNQPSLFVKSAENDAALQPEVRSTDFKDPRAPITCGSPVQFINRSEDTLFYSHPNEFA